MHITSAPPLAVGSLLWRSRPESYVLTIICKATFALKPGQTATVTSPEAPATADRAWHRETQSIGIPTDLVPIKRNVDVLLIGHAYAPQRVPVNALTAGLSFGTINKSILVTGDRAWEPNGTCPEPATFVRMPLCWERAAGGPSTWNPLGIPVGARIDPETRPPIPNLLPRGFVVQNSTHLIPTVGFGAIAPHWPGRAGYVRKWASSWDHAKWNDSVLPQDLDTAYFNSAPADQQLRELPQTTPITLDHFHPDLPRFVSFIEDLRPRAMVTRSPNAAPQELWLRADTVLFDVDRATCSITWRATIPLRHPQEEGVVHVEPTRGYVPVSPPVNTPARLPVQTPVPPPAVPASPKTDVMPSARTGSSDHVRENDARMSMEVDEFTTMPLRSDRPSQVPPLPFRASSPSSPPGMLPFAPPPLPPPQKERPSMSMPAGEGTMLDNQAKPTVDASPLPFRPPTPNSKNVGADDDEVTAIHAKPIPKREQAPAIEPPSAAPPPTAAPPVGVRIGKTLIPDTAPRTESALPFRPVARAPEDPSSARDRFAAMGSSSVLPFQTPAPPTEAPPAQDRLPSAPPAMVPRAPHVSAPEPPVAAISAPSAAPSPSGLPFQPLPSANAPPPPRERLPSAPAIGLPFGTPLGSPTATPAPSPRTSAPGLPFQTPPSTDAPPPRERLPSTPAIGLPFGTPLGSPAATPAPSPRASAPGLPFQTPASTDAPAPPREHHPSAPSIGLPFGTPLGSPAAAPAPSPRANSPGLPFQTPASTDASSRENVPSAPSIGLPFGTPLGSPAAAPAPSPRGNAPGLPFQTPTPNVDPPLPPAHDRLSSPPDPLSFVAPRLDVTPARAMPWDRLSGSSDDGPSARAPTADATSLAAPKVDRSFERYARIKALLWAPDASRDEVLSKHGLDEVEWRIFEQQQIEALDNEAKEGKCDLALALLTAFEAAQTPLLAAS